jgi:hypothetical protein
LGEVVRELFDPAAARVALGGEEGLPVEALEGVGDQVEVASQWR